MSLGNVLLGIAQIIDPLIALLMCAVWDKLFPLSKRQAMFVQLALGLVLLLSLLIPVVLLVENY